MPRPSICGHALLSRLDPPVRLRLLFQTMGRTAQAGKASRHALGRLQNS